MVNKNQVIDEQLEDASGFNVVGLIVAAASFVFLTPVLLIPTLQSTNPVTYFTKPYIEARTTCSFFENQSKYFSLLKLSDVFFVAQVALKLNQIKSCLDTLVYPIESDEYQILVQNIKAVEKLNPEDLLPLEYRNIIESNLTNINLQRAEKTLDTKSQRWIEILLLSGGLTLVVLFSILVEKYQFND